MIITNDFVYIHYPKTGGTFVTQMLYDVYLGKKKKILNKVLTKITKYKPLIEINKHGTCNEIPHKYNNSSILSVVRNPYDRYVSLFEFKWWKNHTEDHFNLNEIKKLYPHFPNINFAEYVTMIDKLFLKDIFTQLNDNMMFLGPQSRQFIYYFFKKPVELSKKIDKDYIVKKNYFEDMYDVHFLHQEKLNDDLYDYLKKIGIKQKNLKFIKKSEKIFPIEGGRNINSKWQDYYTPELKKKVRDREKLLFKIFPEYDV